MKKHIEITEKGTFHSIAPLGPLCADFKVKINDQEKLVRLGISGPEMSAKQWDTNSPKLLELAEDALTGGVIDAFEFEDVYYFTFTGSHFQQDEEIPLWAGIEIYNLK